MNKDQYNEETNFLRVLVTDVQEVLQQAEDLNSVSARRNALRAIISATEGLCWIYRTHVLSVAKDLKAATAQLELAFSETIISVNNQGQMIEQQRYISTLAMIRFATRTAESLCPGLNVDFGDAGSLKLREAMKMRNRITHPKHADDLAVSAYDVAQAKLGFDWFLSTVVNVMAATIAEMASYARIGREIVEQLKQGDPDTLALYQQVHRDLDD